MPIPDGLSRDGKGMAEREEWDDQKTGRGVIYR